MLSIILFTIIIIVLVILLILQLTNKSKGSQTNESLLTQNEQLKETIHQSEVKNAQLTTQVQLQKTQIDEKNQLIAELQQEQKAEKQRQTEEAISQREKEGRILEKIAPVSETVKKMQSKIEELEGERKQQYGSIKELMELNKGQTENLTKVTGILSTALKSNQSRGQWGEAQLKNIVEATGMINHVDFETQSSYNLDSGGRHRPDMIISLPGDKKIIIDAKVPMDKYVESSEISLTDGEDAQNRKQSLLKEHAKAVKLQIDLLSKKEYWDINDIESVDFTLMFLPSEGMLSAALETDPSLLEYAFQKRIALSSPVSLFSVLKTVSFVWQKQALNDNAYEIGELGKDLLDKVNKLAQSSDKLKDSIHKVVNNYNSFAGVLERNIITSANKLAKKVEKSELEPPETLELEENELRTFSKPELEYQEQD